MRAADLHTASGDRPGTAWAWKFDSRNLGGSVESSPSPVVPSVPVTTVRDVRPAVHRRTNAERRRHREDRVFIFFLQLRDTVHGGRLYVFSILVALTWVLWAIKLRLSRRYRPWVADHVTTASVVIPVVDA